MALEQALAEHEEQVDRLIRDAAKYLRGLKAWKAACRDGHLDNRRKAAEGAVAAATSLSEPVRVAFESWAFDSSEYLSGGEWQAELQEVARERHGLRILAEEERLVSSPVVLRALPAQSSLRIGKRKWSKIRPRVVADELRRLRDRASAVNCQQLLEQLQAVYKQPKLCAEKLLTFREAYDVFALAPGWAKDNPWPDFGQAIYALATSGIRSTRSGATYEIAGPSGKYRKGDVLYIRGEDGDERAYYGIRFME